MPEAYLVYCSRVLKIRFNRFSQNFPDFPPISTVELIREGPQEPITLPLRYVSVIQLWGWTRADVNLYTNLFLIFTVLYTHYTRNYGKLLRRRVINNFLLRTLKTFFYISLSSRALCCTTGQLYSINVINVNKLHLNRNIA